MRPNQSSRTNTASPSFPISCSPTCRSLAPSMLNRFPLVASHLRPRENINCPLSSRILYAVGSESGFYSPGVRPIPKTLLRKLSPCVTMSSSATNQEPRSLCMPYSPFSHPHRPCRSLPNRSAHVKSHLRASRSCATEESAAEMKDACCANVLDLVHPTTLVCDSQ